VKASETKAYRDGHPLYLRSMSCTHKRGGQPRPASSRGREKATLQQSRITNHFSLLSRGSNLCQGNLKGSKIFYQLYA